MKLKHILFTVMLIICMAPLSAQVINDSQMIPSNHWIYDYFNKLEMEAGVSLFTDNAPMSVAEAKFNLQKIDYDSLSEPGQSLYDTLEEFLSEKKALYSNGSFKADAEATVTVEGYYKSEEQLPWDYDYNYDGSVLGVPVKFAFSDAITLETDLFCEKNWFAAQDPSNFTNIPLSFDDIRFQFPDYAYGSFVKVFDDWGVSFHIGKQGRRIGFTETGSLVYNDTFETDMYSALSLFSPTFKYTLDVSQISYDQFYYMHQVQGVFFSKLKLTYLQAAMIHDGFSLRQINPMMVMHSFMGNFENCESWEQYYYNESDVCAYLGLMFDYFPVNRLRIYGSYVQTELQVPTEQHDEFIALPNGLGGQFGVSYFIPTGNNTSLKLNLETVYTTPYLYIKQTPKTSLCRLRYTSELLVPSSEEPVATWIGTPYGPDCFAVNGSVGYEVNSKWSVKAGYLFKIHGDNYADMLYDRDEENPNYTWVDINDGLADGGNAINPRKVKVYNYYPFNRYRLAGSGDKSAIIDDALDLWMSGIPEYTNQITISGQYNLNNTWSFSGMFAYDYIINCNNEQENVKSGVEAILSCSCRF